VWKKYCSGVRACRCKGLPVLRQPSVTVWKIQTQLRAIPLSCAVSHLFGMIRLALSRVTFHSTHAPIYPLHRLFSNCRVSLMESESTGGTHRDPVTGEMISKQYVYFPPYVMPLLIDPPCAGNLSVAKSNVKKRQKGRRIPRIGLRARRKTTPQRRLQTRRIFRLMYVGRIDICAITRR
jgi:hypothetical protein